MDKELSDFLNLYPSEVREMAIKARALILEVIPGAVEIVDAPSNIVAYGLGRKYADLICAVQPQKSYVNLIFSKGASLPDPHGLLEGTGKKARHVKIQTAEKLDDPGVRELLAEALGKR